MDSRLPPISGLLPVTPDADDEQSEEEEYFDKRDRFWIKRMPNCATSLSVNEGRRLVNRSSLSDSFSLPGITNQTSREVGGGGSYKKSRTADGRLDRSHGRDRNKTRMPASKSCPSLARRRGVRRPVDLPPESRDGSSEGTSSDKNSCSFDGDARDLRQERHKSAARHRTRTKKKSKVNTRGARDDSRSKITLPDITISAAVNTKNMNGRKDSQSRLPLMFNLHSDESMQLDFPPWGGQSSPLGMTDE